MGALGLLLWRLAVPEACHKLKEPKPHAVQGWGSWRMKEEMAISRAP